MGLPFDPDDIQISSKHFSISMTVTQASPASLGSNIYSLGMDDSDNMLFASLLEMRIKLPASVTCLAEIKSEHLQDILIQMLSLAGS